MFLDDWTTCLCPFLQAQKLESIPIDLLHSNQCLVLFCKLQKYSLSTIISCIQITQITQHGRCSKNETFLYNFQTL